MIDRLTLVAVYRRGFGIARNPQTEESGNSREANSMSYRRYVLGNSVVRGFGYAAGFALFSLVAGAISGATVGLWAATSKTNPVARWIVRGVLMIMLTVGLLVLLADL